jgi:hypothetical protein
MDGEINCGGKQTTTKVSQSLPSRPLFFCKAQLDLFLILAECYGVTLGLMLNRDEA